MGIIVMRRTIRFPAKTAVAAAALLLLIMAAVSSTSASSSHSTTVSRVAFGSCAHQSRPQTIWNAIVGFKPDLFIWLGDNIYGDDRRPFKLFGKERTIGPWKNSPRFIPTSEQEMESRYAKTKGDPGYSQLRSSAKVIGTWDDHDYGLNDAGKEFEGKVTNQKLMLDFLDEPLHSPRREQAGVYTSYTFGPTGRQIKVILFDCRYHRDPFGSDGSILGSSQWAWLEKELYGPPTALTIIGSSIQVISNLSAITSPFFSTESWGRFPKERSRLFKLLADSKRDGVIFLSGDVHFGEIARYDCAVGYQLYDITSSGLTQSVEGAVIPPLHLLVRLMAWIAPTTVRLMAPNCRYWSCTYGRPNFGFIEIDWESDPVHLRFGVKDVDGLEAISINVSMVDLQAGKRKSEARGDMKYCTLETDLPWIVRYRLAILVSFTLFGMFHVSGFGFGFVENEDGAKFLLMVSKGLHDIFDLVIETKYFIWITLHCPLLRLSVGILSFISTFIICLPKVRFLIFRHKSRL